ncbi:hypothetical protein [Streptomyces sp. SD15]
MPESAFGPQAAEAAARIGDGLITTMPDTALVERFRRSGGGTKPVYGGLKVCWGTDQQGRASSTSTARRSCRDSARLTALTALTALNGRRRPWTSPRARRGSLSS